MDNLRRGLVAIGEHGLGQRSIDSNGHDALAGLCNLGTRDRSPPGHSFGHRSVVITLSTRGRCCPSRLSPLIIRLHVPPVPAAKLRDVEPI